MEHARSFKAESRMRVAAAAQRNGAVQDGEGIRPEEFREALANALTPVTVVTTDGEHGLAGVTCSAVCSVCDTPPTVLVCINRRSFTNSVIKGNGVLCVNWLQAGHTPVSQLFAGAGGVPMPERFRGGDWGTLASGAPHYRASLVALDCQVVEAMEIGTHSVFLARVVATAKADEGTPLAYVRRSYATAQPALA